MTLGQPPFSVYEPESLSQQTLRRNTSEVIAVMCQ